MLMQLPCSKDKQNYTEWGEYSQTNRETEGGVCKNRITSDYRQHKVHKTVIIWQAMFQSSVLLSDKAEKNTTIFMRAELENSSGTGLHEKWINERYGHGSVWINNERMNLVHAGGVHCLQECVRWCSISGPPVRMSLRLDILIKFSPIKHTHL